MEDFLQETEKKTLLRVARDAIVRAVNGEKLSPIILSDYSPNLQEDGVTFVTLTKTGKLRGCIGALEPYQPLVLDVQEHAKASAMNDFRFPNVREEELPHLKIEISRLTPIRPLHYSTPQELMSLLRVKVDGVLIKFGGRRATFLPQVWEQVPDTARFLSQLCMKMGMRPELWREQELEVFTYQVEKFEEE
jgi:AmmeMemoRadiSam system protein A